MSEEVNQVSENVRQVQLFQEFIDGGISPKELSKVLTQIYFEYTKMTVAAFRDNYLPVNIDNQLFYLIQLIRICDGEEE